MAYVIFARNLWKPSTPSEQPGAGFPDEGRLGCDQARDGCEGALFSNILLKKIGHIDLPRIFKMIYKNDLQNYFSYT